MHSAVSMQAVDRSARASRGHGRKLRVRPLRYPESAVKGDMTDPRPGGPDTKREPRPEGLGCLGAFN